MPTAEELAMSSAYEFLRNGNYSAAGGPVHIRGLTGVAAAALGEVEEVFAERPDVFAGLAVQAVGCEEGVDNPKVHIYLTRASAKLLKSVPAEIEGVPVRAHKMGPIIVRPEAAASATNHGYLFERNNRICCGSSCAPTSENCSGTFGAIVSIGNAQQRYLLSNNHVFAGCNHVPQDQPILAPSAMDSSPNVRAPADIGRHYQIQELRTGDPHFVNPCEVDLAIAKAINPNLISSWQGDAADGYDTPTAPTAPQSLMPVKKFGRTTALTHGTLEARIRPPQPIPYKAKHFKGTVWFKEVWSIVAAPREVFALPGDSGSLVVTEDGGHAVGLVFAANVAGDYALIIPIANVLAAFGGLQLIGGHGV